MNHCQEPAGPHGPLGCYGLGGRSVLSRDVFIPLCLYVPLPSISCPPSSPQRTRGWFPAACARSHWSTQFLCALLGEQWGGCQPQGAWQRVMAKLPAACRVIPAMWAPWSASRECQRSSSEAVQLATSSKQHYTSLSSKRAHSASLGTVRLREEGWIDQCMDERHHPVLSQVSAAGLPSSCSPSIAGSSCQTWCLPKSQMVRDWILT